MGVLIWLATSPLGRAVALAGLALLAFGAWTYKVDRDAREDALRQAERATAAESARRGRELDIARKNAERRDFALAALQSELDKKLGGIDESSKADDGRVCLPAAASMRLDALRSLSRQGTRNRARAAK